MDYALNFASSKLESYVTPILKKLLEEYFSNFEKDKFKINLPSVGLAVIDLNGLILRTDVLDQFDLPFKVACGKVGKIHIEIQTKTLLYGDPAVDITLSDVYVLVSPPSSLPYDEKIERASFLETKRKNLIAAEAKRAVPVKKEAEDTGLSPMVIGIINNCKVSVKNIHIRYEDAQTPFSFGIVLNDINAISTDSKYEPAGTGSKEATFFKKADLKGLGVYWNTDTTLILSKDKSMDDEIAEMKNLIVDENNNELKYILGPIGATLKAMVTMSPEKLEKPFSKPKFQVDFGMETLYIGITNNQFREILQFGDSIERIERGKKFLKFRPYNVPYKGNYKTWWKFAYNSVLDRIQKRGWKAITLKEAKIAGLCGQYKKLYDKILNKEDEDASRAAAEKLEDDIPNVEILLIRSREELYLKKKDDAAAKKLSKKSWYQSAKDFQLTPEEIKGVLSSKLSPDETNQIMDQISSLREEKPAEVVKFPDDYVDIKFGLNLPQVVLDISLEDKTPENVLNLKASNLDFSLQTRPVNAGMVVDLSMNDLGVTGWKQHDNVPVMVKAIKPTDTTKFLVLNFEKNPQNTTAATKVKLDTKQLEIIYDSKSIQKLIDCFTWPKGVELITVQNAASDAVDTLKSASKDGVKAIADNTAEMDLDIQIHAPYILIPEGGDYFNAASTLVLNLGNLAIRSIPPQRNEPTDASTTVAPDASLMGPLLGQPPAGAEGDVSPAVLKLMYNQYTIELVNTEILFALAGEDIQAAVMHLYKDEVPGVYHMDRPAPLLTSGDIILDLNQCIVQNDERYAKVKADLVIPVLDFQITDFRLLKLIKLVVTLPLPTQAPAEPSAFIDGVEDETFHHDTDLDDIAYVDTNTIKKKLDVPAKTAIRTVELITSDTATFDPEKASQLTDLILDIHLRKIKVVLLKHEGDGASASVSPLLNSKLYNLNMRYKTRTYGTSIDGSIAGMTSAYYKATEPGMASSEETLYLIYTPIPVDLKTSPLIRFHIYMLRDDCPKQPEGAVKKKFDLELYSMDIVLHQESLHVILNIVDSLMKEIQDPGKPKEEEKPNAKENKSFAKFKQQVIKEENIPNPKDVNLNLTALISSISIKLTSEACRIGKITIEELILQYEDRPLQTTIFAQLEGIKVLNLDVNALYPDILTCSTSEKLIIAEIIIFNDKTRAEDLPDLSIDLNFMSPKIILIGSFIGNVLVSDHGIYVKKFFEQLAEQSKAVSTASSKAGAQVVKAAKNVYAKTSSKMALNIKVDAPKVILPKSAVSTDALLLDLGLLTVQNSLSLEESSIKGQNGVMDNIELHLEGINISRTIVDVAAQNTLAELYLLEPVTIDVMIQRNLSASWFTQEPALTISGCLNPTALNASDTDVGLILACVRDLTTGMNTGGTTDPPPVTDVTATADSNVVGGIDTDDAAARQDPITAVAVALGVDLSLEEISLTLHLASPALDGKTGVVARDQKETLAKVSISVLACSMSKWNNNDLDLKLNLNRVLLEDTRAETGGTREFIQKGSDSDPNSDKDMLTVGFSMKIQKELNMLYDVNFQTDSLQIILDVGYLKALKEFADRVMRTIPKSKEKPAAIVPAVKESAVIGAVELQTDAEVPTTPAPPPLINASIRLSEVDVLVLDDVNDQDTNALQIKLNGSFTMIQQDSGSHGEGDFNLTSNTAKYSPNKSNELRTKIVEFEDIEFVADIGQDAGTVVSVHLPNTYFRVSAGTLLLITKILNRFNGSNDSAAIDDDEIIDYSGVWDAIDNRTASYWFLDPALFVKPKPALALKAASRTSAKDESKESLSIKSGKILICLEVGVGSMTTPLITVETTLTAEIKNWSRDLTVVGGLALSASYNNTYIGMWEYLLEPTTVDDPTNFGPPALQPWQLDFLVGYRPLPAGSVAKAPLVVGLQAEKIMEITLSRTAFSVMQALADNWAASTSSSETTGASESSVNTPPYLLRNHSGSNISFNIDGTDLTCVKGGEALGGEIPLASGDEIDLGILLDNSHTISSRRHLTVSIPDYKFKKVVSVNHAQPRFYPVTPGNTNSKYGILFDMVTTTGLSTLITLRSIVQVENDLHLPVSVFSIAHSKINPIGSMQPGKKLNLPLSTVYSGIDGLIFQVQGYQKTAKAYTWLGSSSKTATSLTAKSSAADGLDANMKIFSETHEAVLEDTTKTTPLGLHYTLKLQAPVLVNNYLPTPLTISIGGKSVGTIEPGQVTNVLGLDPAARGSALELKLSNFQGQDWTFKMFFSSMDTKALNSIQFTGTDKKTVYLGCRKKVENEITQISIYYPYWIVNQTGLKITYKGDKETEVTHLSDDPGPIMFAYQTHAKNKALFKVEDSDWSEKMNLDAAMTSVFTCKGKTQDYQVTVAIALSESAMTKIVRFLPKFTISNTCPYNVQVEEKDANNSSALIVPAKTTCPFWPKFRKDKDTQVLFSVTGTSEESQSIFMNRSGTNILRFDNKYGGVCASVHAMETKSTLTLSEFMPGDTPILLVNDTTELQIEFQQKNSATKRTVDSGKSQIYTWEDFTTDNGQSLFWKPTQLSVRGFPMPIDTVKPASGTFAGPSKTYYWISFPHGLRTIFILSEKPDLVRGITDYMKIGATSSVKSDGTSDADSVDNAPTLDVSLKLDGIGISLVDNIKAREVLYIRIESTDVIWEETEPKGKKYKVITDNRLYALENGYMEYISGKLTQRPATLAGGVQIDYADFMQTKPSKMQLRRRAYQPGLKIGYKTYENSIGANLSLSQLQIDNQLPNAEYPRTFTIAPIPKSVTNDTEVHPPLLIVDYKQRTQPKSTVKMISATVILQESKLAADMALINTVLAILPGGSNENAVKEASGYQNDYALASKTGKEYFAEELERVKNNIEQTILEKIEIYMLKLKVTFAMSKDDDDSYLKSVLMGLGSMVISVTDKPFKVDGFKIENKAMTQQQLMDTIVDHYKSGIISNLYTVVLELDVLGNPYKLLTGLTTGLSSFVEEPLQGAMNGNLIEGVSNGVGAVLDGTVFGLTDTLGSIAKSLGKGVNALGIPILGDLIGGLGKGLLFLGNVTGNNDAVVPAIRLPRPIKPKTHLEPFSDYSTVGDHLYGAMLANYPSAGPYLMHFVFGGAKPQALVLSKDMVFYVNLALPSFNVSSVNWAHKWSDFVSITKIVKTNEVVYNLPPAAHGLFGLGNLVSGDKTLEVKTASPEMCQWVHDKSEVIRKAPK